MPKITDLATGTVSDTDEIPVVDGGATRKAAMSDVRGYVLGDIDDRLVAVEDDPLGLDLIANADPIVVNTTTSPGANIRVYSRLLAAGTVEKIGLEVTVQSGNIRLAIHRNSGSGRDSTPGELIGDTGTVSCPAVGWAEVSLLANVTVETGDWISIAADGTATFRAVSNVNFSSNNLFKGRCAAKNSDFTPASNPAPTFGSQRMVFLAGIPPL